MPLKDGEAKPNLTEAELTRQIKDYLKFGMNQGKWWAERLNSGSAFVWRGGTPNRIELCEPGTADFIVLQSDLLSDGVHATRIPAVRAIFLEVKRPGKKLSGEQEAFKRIVEAQNALFFRVESLEEVQEILEG